MGTVENDGTTRVTGTEIRMLSPFVVEKVSEASREAHMKSWNEFIKRVPEAAQWTGRSKRTRQGFNKTLKDVQAVGVMNGTLLTW